GCGGGGGGGGRVGGGGGEAKGSLGGVSAFATSPVGSIVFSISRLRLIWLAERMASRASSSSASRKIWSMPLWNSAASRRPLRTQKATARIAFGRAFGPITTRATTAIIAISDHPISNNSILECLYP